MKIENVPFPTMSFWHTVSTEHVARVFPHDKARRLKKIQIRRKEFYYSYLRRAPKYVLSVELEFILLSALNYL